MGWAEQWQGGAGRGGLGGAVAGRGWVGCGGLGAVRWAERDRVGGRDAGLTCRHPFSLTQASMAMKAVIRSGFRQPFLYQ